MRDGSNTCKPEEYVMVQDTVEKIGWWNLFSKYLKAVSLTTTTKKAAITIGVVF